MDEELVSVAIISASERYLGGHWVQAKQLLDRLRCEKYVSASHLPVDPLFPGWLGWLRKIRYFRTVVNTCIYVVSLFKDVRKYDVLHIFSASYSSFLLAPTPAVLVGKLFGKKVILNYHSGEAEDHLKRSFWVVSRIFKKAHALVVPSLYLENIFESFGFHAEVIFNVVDLKRFPFKQRRCFRPSFLVNRNLEPMYNVACVLKAFRIIQEHCREAELMVIGTGSEEKALKKLSKDLSLKNVLFAGKVDHERMPGYFAKADLFLNASNIDNMPISILEAFCSGLPVISTKVGGIAFMIDDNRNGFLVKKNDHEWLAKKALFVLKNAEVASRVARTAREDCEKLYSWEANGKKWLELYNRCVEKPRDVVKKTA